jgi:hypothetical protein
MTGCRRFVEPHALQPGEYCLHGDTWYACTPDGRLANLRKHIVEIDHDTWSITVHPSILVRGGGQPGEWHGWLKRGVWSC